jgi:hypothetical protein
VPASKKKIDTQKARLPFAPAIYLQQQQQHQQQPSPSPSSSSTQFRTLKNMNNIEINGSMLASLNSARSVLLVAGSPSPSSTSVIKHANLAVQHQEEIYALINKSSGGKSKGLETVESGGGGLGAKLILNTSVMHVASSEKQLAVSLVSQQGKQSKKTAKATKSTKRPRTSKL